MRKLIPRLPRLLLLLRIRAMQLRSSLLPLLRILAWLPRSPLPPYKARLRLQARPIRQPLPLRR
jgi:hypothetical protein